MITQIYSQNDRGVSSLEGKTQQGIPEDRKRELFEWEKLQMKDEKWSFIAITREWEHKVLPKLCKTNEKHKHHMGNEEGRWEDSKKFQRDSRFGDIPFPKTIEGNKKDKHSKDN